MSATVGSRWGDGIAGRGDNRPFAKYQAETGTFEASMRDPQTGRFQAYTIPPGSKIIIDFLHALIGPMIWKPTVNRSHLVPLHQEVRPAPVGDGREWKLTLVLQVYFESLGLNVLTSSSTYFLTVMEDLFGQYSHASEAQAGQLPVYGITESTPIYNATWGKNFYPPALTLVGWTERGTDVFGLPLSPPPLPMLPAAEAPLTLPKPANDAAAAPAVPPIDQPVLRPVPPAPVLPPGGVPVTPQQPLAQPAPAVRAAPPLPPQPQPQPVPPRTAPPPPPSPPQLAAAQPMPAAAPLQPATDPLARYRPISTLPAAGSETRF